MRAAGEATRKKINDGQEKRTVCKKVHATCAEIPIYSPGGSVSAERDPEPSTVAAIDLVTGRTQIISFGTLLRNNQIYHCLGNQAIAVHQTVADISHESSYSQLKNLCSQLDCFPTASFIMPGKIAIFNSDSNELFFARRSLQT